VIVRRRAKVVHAVHVFQPISILTDGLAPLLVFVFL
jgi:hypothetical protein